MSGVWGVERPLEAPYGFRGDRLSVDGVPLERIADRYGTPTYVTSEERLRANLRRFRDAFREWAPRFQVHYALKANEQPAVVRIVRSEGAGADCSSPLEIEIALRAGVPPSEVMYTAAYPSADDLRFALRSGVIINLDHPALLAPLLAIGVPRVLSLRLNPGVRRSGPEGLALGGTESKFGGPLSATIEAFRRARRAGVERFGVHTMLGSNLLDARAFRPTARVLATCLRRLRAVGVPVDFVDTGGGFGVPYRPRERPLDLRAVSHVLRGPIVAAARDRGRGSPRDLPTLKVEPGRYLLADTTVLLTRVTFVKHSGHRYVGIDAGMNTLLRPALYGAYHAVYPVRADGSAPRRAVDVVGPVCEPADALARHRPLPPLVPGDLLAVGNAGAYGFSMASHFNGRPLPAEVLVYRRRADLIRRREGYRDLTGTSRLPARLGGRP